MSRETYEYEIVSDGLLYGWREKGTTRHPLFINRFSTYKEAVEDAERFMKVIEEDNLRAWKVVKK